MNGHPAIQSLRLRLCPYFRQSGRDFEAVLLDVVLSGRCGQLAHPTHALMERRA